MNLPILVSNTVSPATDHIPRLRRSKSPRKRCSCTAWRSTTLSSTFSASRLEVARPIVASDGGQAGPRATLASHPIVGHAPRRNACVDAWRWSRQTAPCWRCSWLEPGSPQLLRLGDGPADVMVQHRAGGLPGQDRATRQDERQATHDESRKISRVNRHPLHHGLR